MKKAFVIGFIAIISGKQLREQSAITTDINQLLSMKHRHQHRRYGF